MSRQNPGTGGDQDSLPEPTVSRLPLYLRCLDRLYEAGSPSIDSVTLAKMAGVAAHNLRKDLAYLGNLGVRGSGYDVGPLREKITRILGADQEWKIVICGVGNLGTAFANYLSRSKERFVLDALFDNNVNRIGERVAGVTVSPIETLPEVISGNGSYLGIITTPPEVAFDISRRLVSSGVRSMLNFAPVHIDLGEGTMVRNVDVGLHLLMLSYHEML